MVKKSFMPPTPKWLDNDVLFRPSLSMALYQHDLEEKKFNKKVVVKKEILCSDCMFNHPDEGIPCGLYSLDCQSSAKHPRFQEKKLKGVR